MPQSNVTIRPSANSVRPAGAGKTGAASGSRFHRSDASHEELELPLAPSPPISVASARSAAPISGVSLRVHSDLEEIRDEWKTFERHADRTVFQTFDWLADWQREIGAKNGTIPAIVLGRETGGQLLFILQFAVETQGMARRLSWLGWQLCDYNAPLLAEHFSDRMSAERFMMVWQDVIKLLRANPRLRFDLIDLQKMPEMVGAQRNPFLDLQVLPHPSGAYVANLGGDWETFYAAKRSASTRKRERRQLKHLAEHGDVRFVDVKDRDEMAATLATLMSQKSRALARMGVDDFFAKPGRRNFFNAVVTNPALQDVIHVSRLDVGSTVAATNVGLRFRDCYYLILSSYDDGELSRFGPGRAHLQELIQHAIRCGFRHFDFTVGDEPYKHDWADVELKLYDHLEAATPWGSMIMATTTAFRRTKRLIKQSPVLWRAFSKARALAGPAFAGTPSRRQDTTKSATK
jgi:CelD/BcsL family acetyltransferase involved in cellulose biosynthesis